MLVKCKETLTCHHVYGNFAHLTLHNIPPLPLIHSFILLKLKIEKRRDDLHQKNKNKNHDIYILEN
jgi:hypothetical protein